MKILGVDPGSTRVGYGVISYESQRTTLLAYGVLEIQARAGPARIGELSRRFKEILNTWKPDVAGIETLYFAKNQKTALTVAESRGVLMLHLVEQGMPILELRPGDVKSAVADYALADKKAIAKMVKKTLGVTELSGHDDATDALAIAIATARAHEWKTRLSDY